MKLAIYGSQKAAKMLHKMVIDHIPQATIICFIENNHFNLIGDSIEGIQIVSLYKSIAYYKAGKIDGIVIPGAYHKYHLDNMVKLLLKHGVSNSDIFITPVNLFRKTINGSVDKKSILTKYDDFIQLFDVVMHLNDDCNLNCKSCSVFSNAIKMPSLYDIKTFQKDINRLHELVENVVHISLLGGEPLLIDNIQEYISLSRKQFPHAQITLTTNGILLPRQSPSFYDCIKENNVCIKLSLYPVLASKVDQYVKILKSNEIFYVVNPIYQFDRRLSLHPFMSKEKSAEKCKYLCLGMRDGKIYRCELAQNIRHFNQAFKEGLPDNGGVDIHNSSMTGADLMKVLRRPIDLCAYCSDGLIFEFMDWEKSRGEPTKDEYLNSHIKNLRI